ncbi:MAG: TIGR00730 family Rossman fold protein [Polyangiaceae bacterium]
MESAPSPMRLRRVCVFCGSRSGGREIYVKEGARLGRALAARGIALVYGGSQIGVMGSVANAVLASGGEVIGVIPHGLADKEVAHHGLTELRVTKTMHERKAMMADLSDAFIALPGGFGTFDELFEIITWAQIGLHAKAIGVLDTEAYFQPLRALMANAVKEEFASPEHTAMVSFEDDPDKLLDAVSVARTMPVGPKWIGDRER